MSKKTIVFTFGRFQPPTTGHGKLFNAVISHAKSVGGEHRIYASQSFDGGRPRAAVKNPLRYEDKIRFLKQMFPQANIVKSGAGIDTFMDVLYDLEKRGYKKIHMIVGEDRVEGIQNTVDKYLNTGGEKALNLEEFKVVSAGHRDPEATGVEGMSASKLRAAVAANDFKLFKTGMPKGFSGARELFDAIAKGLEKPMKKSKKTISEKAPPDEKAERMISKAKDSFQDRYGDNADSYLYGVAWKQYNKRHGIKTKTRLGEPIMEGAVKASMEDWLYDLPKAVISEIKKKYGKILAAANKPPYKTVFSADVKDGIGKILMANKVKHLMGSHEESVGAITMSFDTYHGVVNEVDMTGKKCTTCKKGTYQETSQMDDMDGVLHCTNCGKKIKRYQSVDPKTNKPVKEERELDEAITIPKKAEVVGRNKEEKTVTVKWNDADGWHEEEIPEDELPGFYDRAAQPLKARKTDRLGNIMNPPKAGAEKKTDSAMASNKKNAQEIVDIFKKKPMKTPITVYGKKYGKTDDYEMVIVRRLYMGDEVYVVKSSGRFVEMRVGVSGLQIVDTKTKKILLDKGNDAIW